MPQRPAIHATLGPACSSREALRDLLQAGVDACRINLSHVEPRALAIAVGRAREVAAQLGRPLRVGADLRGRKLRIGTLPGGGVVLRPGQGFTLLPADVDAEGLGAAQEATVCHPHLDRIAQPGDRVLLDDGALQLRVQRIAAGRVDCEVERGGDLPERSGVNLPGRRLALPPLSAKDDADLDALALLAPDHVYLSYVESAGDVEILRRALARRGLEIPIVAKIERAAAVDQLDAIAGAADALCLARGDLGVEVPLPSLLEVQRHVAAAAHRATRPLLLAGELLASLVTRTTPLRAEAIDLALSRELGFDGYVLSDETAIGVDPAGAVRWLRALAGIDTAAS